jgi:hypothetical protein
MVIVDEIFKFTLQLNTNGVAHKTHDIRNQRDAHNPNIQVNI